MCGVADAGGAVIGVSSNICNVAYYICGTVLVSCASRDWMTLFFHSCSSWSDSSGALAHAAMECNCWC